MSPKSLYEDVVLLKDQPKCRFEFSQNVLRVDKELVHIMDLQFNQHLLGLQHYDLSDRFVKVLLWETPITNQILIGEYLKRVPLDSLEIFHSARHILVFKTCGSSFWSRYVMDEKYWTYEVQLNFLTVEFKSEEL